MKPAMREEGLCEGRAIAVEEDPLPVKTRTNSYRRDLQGIRAIAIISVLLFHFYPSIFPNGHVGVDQLFLFEHLQPPNLESAKYALLFTTNIEATDSVKEYQTMLTRAADLFTHTWSIAVEMQFYAVFPAIFMVFKMLPDYAAMTVLKGLGEFFIQVFWRSWTKFFLTRHTIRLS
ncbi:hypothetical protein ANCDUO_06193 [Ancylostoma duodenale]|uniref:Acyltransferase 3 domain-containing protein n=1 Tax=Ancylostoma duodenale TaxID=51022 RepID=A0A0C2D2C5_9BILA|nr:hypothetical protein ANCDUO_06193 [Ancylostoma duodenale]